MTLHRIHVSILRSLRRSQSVRFSDLLRPTGLESDTFKFYLRKLVQLQYVAKTEAGTYELTPKGKEFANNLDELRLSIIKQPKISVIIVVSRTTGQGRTEYLVQKRLRQPFMHYWGFLSGPMLWGEDVEAVAERELHKQTGLSLSLTVKAFCRARDYNDDSNELLEDKLFIILRGNGPSCDPDNSWNGGTSQWMTLEALTAQEKYFELSSTVAAALDSGQVYFNHMGRYGSDY